MTYIDTEDGTCYLSIITDTYSHKIVGWSLGETLEAKHPIRTLEKALEGFTCSEEQGLIHHSDRGVQYCCHKYVDILQENNIAISMTENGDPLENAIAERVNGILKSEWLYHTSLKDLDDANQQICAIIEFYNQERPHLSIDMLTPEQAHQVSGELKQCWQNYYTQKASETSFSFQQQR
ncbi:MAG: IS3 family transposase [Tannerellaceae bacterium]